MSGEGKNLFFAILISIAFIFGYNKFFVEPKVKKQQEIAKTQKVAEQNNTSVAVDDGSGVEKKTGIELTPTGNHADLPVAVPLNREELIDKGFDDLQRVKINTGKLHGSINLKGASFDDLTLAEYKETIDPNSKEVILLSPKSMAEVYFTETGWLSNSNISLPNKDTVWSADRAELDVDHKVNLRWDNGAGLVFKKTISLDDKYMFTVTDSVENNSGADVSISSFGLINRSKGDHKETYVSHEGPLASVNGVLELATYDKIFDEKSLEYKDASGWAAIGDKYWLTAIIPDQKDTETKYTISFKSYEKDKTKRFQVDVLSAPKKLATGATLTNTTQIFAGAKKVKFLDEYAEQYSIPLFDRAVDFGSLYFLTKPMFEVLHFSYEKIGNFGIAILCLTVVVRLFLFPLANMSYKSMAKMKKHMPEINKIKEKFSTDKQKQGMEMMKFYKEKKVNPATGCLPLLVQIPVFFALYKVLYVTIEMRHAPFYLWIHDLSDKDHTNIFNLFGLIPLVPPVWLPAIGVLPILYTLTMVLQQKLNPPATDPSQAIVIKFMPWIFLFIFAGFPAGLVLYWVWNNILSIVQQYIITKRIEASKDD